MSEQENGIGAGNTFAYSGGFELGHREAPTSRRRQYTGDEQGCSYPRF